MRRKYVYDRAKGEMVEVSIAQRRPSGIMIMPDIPAFQSPIDKTEITGRRSLAEHNKRHNVTNVADFTNQWNKQAAERQEFFTSGTHDREERRQQISHAIDKLRRR